MGRRGLIPVQASAAAMRLKHWKCTGWLRKDISVRAQATSASTANAGIETQHQAAITSEIVTVPC